MHFGWECFLVTLAQNLSIESIWQMFKGMKMVQHLLFLAPLMPIKQSDPDCLA